MQLDLDLDRFLPHLRLRRLGNQRQVFDPIRGRWLVLQPEEFVRQLLVQYLLHGKGYNRNRISIERGLQVNGLSKRCDVLVYDPAMQPYLLVECKAPEVELTEATFRQIATYNLCLRVRYLLVTNGRTAYCCALDYERQSFRFLEGLPEYTRAGDGENG